MIWIILSYILSRYYYQIKLKNILKQLIKILFICLLIINLSRLLFVNNLDINDHIFH